MYSSLLFDFYEHPSNGKKSFLCILWILLEAVQTQASVACVDQRELGVVWLRLAAPHPAPPRSHSLSIHGRLVSYAAEVSCRSHLYADNATFPCSFMSLEPPALRDQTDGSESSNIQVDQGVSRDKIALICLSRGVTLTHRGPGHFLIAHTVSHTP